MDKSFSDAVISVYKLLVVLAVPQTLICFQLCEIQLNSYIGAGCKRCITTFVYRHPMLSIVVRIPGSHSKGPIPFPVIISRVFYVSSAP